MKNERWFVAGFIAFSTLVMFLMGSPKAMVILAGAINGLILPISLGIILIASRNKKIVGNYKHPMILIVLGVIVALAAAYLGGVTFLQKIGELGKLFTGG